MRCITHNATIFKEDKPGEHDGEKRYAVEVDLSEVSLNEEFLIVIEATYWNGFSNLFREDASTNVDGETEELKELSLIIFLPESKPFKSYRLKRKIGDRPEKGFTHNIGHAQHRNCLSRRE
jgi:hypothetical protein